MSAALTSEQPDELIRLTDVGTAWVWSQRPLVRRWIPGRLVTHEMDLDSAYCCAAGGEWIPAGTWRFVVHFSDVLSFAAGSYSVCERHWEPVVENHPLGVR